MVSRIFILIFLCLSFCGCDDKFPAEYIYNIDHNKKVCDRYRINQDKITFKFDSAIKFSECPVLYGFTGQDIGEIMSWIRRNKTKIEECR